MAFALGQVTDGDSFSIYVAGLSIAGLLLPEPSPTPLSRRTAATARAVRSGRSRRLHTIGPSLLAHALCRHALHLGAAIASLSHDIEPRLHLKRWRSTQSV